MSVMAMAEAERADLAALLATLSPQQWEEPSLCEGWRVKDVVAHMVSYEELGPGGLLKRFVKGRFVHANAIGVAQYRALSTTELVEFLGAHLRPRGLTAGFGGMIALVDGLIHHQDIRRPLGLARSIPPERLWYVLDRTLHNPRLGTPRRIRGLRLHTTDLDFTAGNGAEVRGTAEAILMSITGRPGVVGELTGPGQPLLAQRIAKGLN